MENTITNSVSDTYQELRPHGDTSFPFDSGYTTDATHTTPWHWHEEYELSVLLKGRTPLHIGPEELLLEEGDAVFINSGVLHIQPTENPSYSFQKYDILFHGRLLYGSKYTVFWQNYIQLIASNPSLPYIHFRASVPWQRDVILLTKKVADYAQEQPFGYEFQIRNALSQIFLLICENRKELIHDTQVENFQQILHVKKMLGYIQQNFTEPIMLKDLASSASICEREVQRVFQNIIHQSPIQYLIRYRIGKACQMLDSGEQSIIEICNSCGFSSPSYFSKTFKKIVGCTPKEYRKTR